jgi:glucose/mannose-6-phosphate isomerase
VGGVGAQRFASQLAANAKVPAPWSALPDAAYDAIVALDGPYGGGSRDDDDFFRDRVAAPEEPLRMRVVLVRDTVEHPRVAARRRALRAVTESRDIVVRELTADGEHPVERLATLIGTGDFASIYLALGAGVDPTSTPATDQLKERISR